MTDRGGGGGIGFVGLLQLVFIALKLSGQLQWGWAWVLAPFWISALVWIAVFLAVLTLYLRDR